MTYVAWLIVLGLGNAALGILTTSPWNAGLGVACCMVPFIRRRQR